MNFKYILTKIKEVVNDINNYFGLESNAEKSLYYSVYGLGTFIAGCVYFI